MHRCDALVAQQKKGRKYYEVMFVPCGVPNADLHHKLTRARGGLILDKAGETYHHLYLCRDHHAMAHDEDNAFANGLLIRGYVITGVDDKPRYFGPDEYLTEKYGEQT
jgi:hypothetical protein